MFFLASLCFVLRGFNYKKVKWLGFLVSFIFILDNWYPFISLQTILKIKTSCYIIRWAISLSIISWSRFMVWMILMSSSSLTPTFRWNIPEQRRRMRPGDPRRRWWRSPACRSWWPRCSETLELGACTHWAGASTSNKQYKSYEEEIFVLKASEYYHNSWFCKCLQSNRYLFPLNS